jgi:hypothetical protein
MEAIHNYEIAVVEAQERGIPVKALMLCSPHNPLGEYRPITTGRTIPGSFWLAAVKKPALTINLLFSLISIGRCFPREVLREYMRFCQRHQLHLLSDEIYALSVWENPDFPDAPGFTSVLSIDIKGVIDPSLVHVLWGMSKVRVLLRLSAVVLILRRTLAPTVYV